MSTSISLSRSLKAKLQVYGLNLVFLLNHLKDSS